MFGMTLFRSVITRPTPIGIGESLPTPELEDPGPSGDLMFTQRLSPMDPHTFSGTVIGDYLCTLRIRTDPPWQGVEPSSSQGFVPSCALKTLVFVSGAESLG